MEILTSKEFDSFMLIFGKSIEVDAAVFKLLVSQEGRIAELERELAAERNRK